MTVAMVAGIGGSARAQEPMRGGIELPIGVQIGAPFKAGLSVGLLAGVRTSSQWWESITGLLVEGRLGFEAGTLALGAEVSGDGGDFGTFGAAVEATRTWKGPLDGPWLLPAGQTLLGGRLHATLLRIQLFVGGLFNSDHAAVTFGLGYRHPLYSSSK